MRGGAGAPPSLIFRAAAPVINRAVEGGIKGIKVFAVQIVLKHAKGFSESLEMDNFPLPQKTDGVADLRILDKAEDVVIGGTGFLFWYNCVFSTKSQKNKNE